MTTTLRLGLAGLGTVGTGLLDLLASHSALIAARTGTAVAVVAICARDRKRDRGGHDLARYEWFDDPVALAASDKIDVFVELMGGEGDPARAAVEAALKAGKAVVTANKALLAHHGTAFARLADAAGVALNFEAAVAGGIPIVKTLRESLAGNQVRQVFGILNGTCNYILTKMADEGRDFSDVLAEAQALGYAEADPTFDIGGFDTAHKLALITALAFGTEVDLESIYIEGIEHITLADIRNAANLGYTIKLLGVSVATADGLEQRVHPTLVPVGSQIADVDGVFNAVRLFGDFVGPVMLYGRGAGMEATASAVMGDVMAIARNVRSGAEARTPALGCCPEFLARLPVKPMADIVSHYYLRFGALDKPGVLGQVAGILGRYNISIASMIQPERQIGGAVPIVLMTHEAREADVCSAITEIDRLPLMSQPSRFIRIESQLD